MTKIAPHKHDASTAMDVLRSFFSGAGQCTIDARSESGQPAAALDRNAPTILTRSVSVAKSWAAAAAIGAAAAVIPMHADAGNKAPASDGVYGMSMKAMDSMAKSVAGETPYAAGKSWVKVTEAALPGSSGPAANFKTHDNGRFSCTVSVDLLDDVAKRFIGKDPTFKQRFTQYTIQHEASHCEFNAKVRAFEVHGKAEPVQGESYGFATLARFKGDMGAIYMNKFKVYDTVETSNMQSISESYADARSLLIMAAKDVSAPGIRSPEQAGAALSAFNAFTDKLVAERARVSDDDPEHDSSSLMKNVQRFVQTKASTAEGLAELKAMAANPSLASKPSLQWAVADAVERSPQVNQAVVGRLLYAAEDRFSMSGMGGIPSNMAGLILYRDDIHELLDQKKDVGLKLDDFKGEVRDMLKSSIQSYEAVKEMTPKAQAPSLPPPLPEASPQDGPAEAPAVKLSSIDIGAMAMARINAKAPDPEVTRPRTPGLR